MKNYFLILFLVFSSALLKAQSNTFEKVIDTLGSAGSFCIRQTFDGGYVFCGTSQYGGNDAEIVKLDSTGQIEWAKTYGGPGIESAQTIEQTPDSGYMVNASYDSPLNSKSWLLRLDANGDTLWTKTFSAGNGGTEVEFANTMASYNNLIYGLTGYFAAPGNVTNAYFIGALSNGILISTKNYTSNYGNDSRAIAKTTDGFIMAGEIGSNVSVSDFYIIRTDIYGDTIWTTSLDRFQNESVMDIKQTNDSNFIAVGFTYDPAFIRTNIFLFKVDTSGNIIGTKQFYSPFNQVAYSFQQTSDGGYIITGSTMNINLERNLLLIKTDVNGDTLWTSIFDVSINCTGYFVRQTKDNGYIISGISQNGIGGTYIIKTDSMGRVSSATGLAEVNNPLIFELYPNPSSGIFSILAKGINKKNAKVKIYNINNQCIYCGSIKNNLLLSINLSNFSDGLYVAVLTTEQKIYTRKILIQH